MPFPLVTRRAFDQLEQRRRDAVDAHERERVELRADLASERLRSAKLTLTLLRMKRDGATLMPERQLTLSPRVPTPIEQAIADDPRAKRNPRLAAYLSKWASEQEAAGIAVEKIVEQLADWNAGEREAEEPSGL